MNFDICEDQELSKEPNSREKGCLQALSYQVNAPSDRNDDGCKDVIAGHNFKTFKAGRTTSRKPHNLRIVSLSSPKPFFGSKDTDYTLLNTVCQKQRKHQPKQTEKVRANKKPFITPLPLDICFNERSSQYCVGNTVEESLESLRENPETRRVNSNPQRTSKFSNLEFLNRWNDLKCRKGCCGIYKYSMGNNKTKYHMDDQTSDDLKAHPVAIAEYNSASSKKVSHSFSKLSSYEKNSNHIDSEITDVNFNVPELIISTTEDTEQESRVFDETLTEGKSMTELNITAHVIDEGITLEKTTLRNSLSSDSAYSSDSRSTSVDSAPVGSMDQYAEVPSFGPPSAYTEQMYGKQNKLLSARSSSSSSSSSPGHSPGRQRISSDHNLSVVSSECLQRELSCSSFRSSLSFESEDDFLSNESEMPAKEITGKRKAQNSWKKIRQMVIWSPFMQSFKKKYPWVQLAGHAGNFQPGEEGCILKKHCGRESECLRKLSEDDQLKSFAPEYHGIVEKENQKYTRMQDLLLEFDCPSVMDCKMGIRTYLEDELIKAKIQPKLRHDMYLKMKDVAPNEPTAEEHKQQAVTKPRYMQWREDVSSSSNLGFRIEGIKKGENDPSKDYKLTKTEHQLKKAFKYFIDSNLTVLEKYIERLYAIRNAAENSNFFMTHEVIGSSLLFVHDKTSSAGIWMIDFGKTSQLPNNTTLTHRNQWIEGNREDGYLFGLDNLIQLFEEIHNEMYLEQPAAEDTPVDNNNQSKDSVPSSVNTKTSLRELSPNSSNDSGDNDDANDDKVRAKSRTKPVLVRQNAHSSKSCDICGIKTDNKREDNAQNYDVADTMTSLISTSSTDESNTYKTGSNNLSSNSNT